MKLEEHEQREDKKVWLSRDEVDTLMEHVEGDTTKTLAFGFGVRCGLRAQEIVNVEPDHIAKHETGPRLRVVEGKGNKYREVPLPVTLYAKADAVEEFQDEDKLVPKSTRTLERWVSAAGEELAQETGDGGWKNLAPHDLRRTWGTLLVSTAEVEPGMVMEWGGWSDWDTFREHYLGAYSPEAEKEQIDKVSWL